MVSMWGEEEGFGSYIEDNPDEPGVRCLRMELSLSPAMMKDLMSLCEFVGELKEL